MTYSPYQPPQGPLGYGYASQPPADWRYPARRAGVLMFVLAALLLACGVFIMAMAQGVDWNAVWDKSAEMYGPQFTDAMKAQHVTPDQLKSGVLFWAVVGLLSAVGFILLGLFVFRGSFGATITSILFTSLLLLLNLCSSLSVLAMLPRMAANGVVVMVITLLPLILACVLMYFLISAARAISRSRSMQNTQLAYWQQMQVQNPPQSGYGYGIPQQYQPGPAPQQMLGPVPPPSQSQQPPTGNPPVDPPNAPQV